MLDIVYQDNRILVCVKPTGVRSTDEPGGMPELLRQVLGDTHACIRTVHRLDQVVSGLMVFARSRVAASLLCEQMRARTFEKEYLAVLHGVPPEQSGILRDLLHRDKQTQTTRVVQNEGMDVQQAALSYRLLQTAGEFSLVQIRLHTGRTHQIRVQFASRGLPLVGDRKYGLLSDDCPIGLWSCRLAFAHPQTGQPLEFFRLPPSSPPWDLFSSWGQLDKMP